MNGDDGDNFEWLFQELLLTAERARDHGLTPSEFLIGLRAYARLFEEDYEDYAENAGD